MDEDDEDAHHHYHQLHHLYDHDFHHHHQQHDPNEDEGDEDNVEDDDEDEEDQDHQLEHDLGPGDEGEPDYVQHAQGHHGALFNHRAALRLSQPDAAFASSARTEGDKHNTHNTRDDWSEGATYALLEAWGDRYLQLNKGSLKQEDWEEVAKLVSTTSKSTKTDVQCKNRLDTLKKKYKVEKQKQSASGSSASKWPFYKQLDKLLSATTKRAGISGAIDARHAVMTVPTTHMDEFDRLKNEEDPKSANDTSTTSKSKDSPEISLSSPEANGGSNLNCRKRKCEDSPFRTLAKAISKFGEIYEKIENTKLQQLVDLEKIRMEFTRDLELQRMQLFMQTQVEIAKMKHGAHDPTANM